MNNLEIICTIAGTFFTFFLMLGGMFSFFMKRLDKKFDAIDRRFDTIDRRFETIDRRFEKIETKLETITDRVSRIEGHLYRFNYVVQEPVYRPEFTITSGQ